MDCDDNTLSGLREELIAKEAELFGMQGILQDQDEELRACLHCVGSLETSLLAQAEAHEDAEDMHDAAAAHSVTIAGTRGAEENPRQGRRDTQCTPDEADAGRWQADARVEDDWVMGGRPYRRRLGPAANNRHFPLSCPGGTVVRDNIALPTPNHESLSKEAGWDQTIKMTVAEDVEDYARDVREGGSHSPVTLGHGEEIKCSDFSSKNVEVRESCELKQAQRRANAAEEAARAAAREASRAKIEAERLRREWKDMQRWREAVVSLRTALQKQERDASVDRGSDRAHSDPLARHAQWVSSPALCALLPELQQRARDLLAELADALSKGRILATGAVGLGAVSEPAEVQGSTPAKCAGCESSRTQADLTDRDDHRDDGHHERGVPNGCGVSDGTHNLSHGARCCPCNDSAPLQVGFVSSNGAGEDREESIASLRKECMTLKIVVQALRDKDQNNQEKITRLHEQVFQASLKAVQQESFLSGLRRESEFRTSRSSLDNNVPDSGCSASRGSGKAYEARCSRSEASSARSIFDDKRREDVPSCAHLRHDEGSVLAPRTRPLTPQPPPFGTKWSPAWGSSENFVRRRSSDPAGGLTDRRESIFPASRSCFASNVPVDDDRSKTSAAVAGLPAANGAARCSGGRGACAGAIGGQLHATPRRLSPRTSAVNRSCDSAPDSGCARHGVCRAGCHDSPRRTGQSPGGRGRTPTTDLLRRVLYADSPMSGRPVGEESTLDGSGKRLYRRRRGIFDDESPSPPGGNDRGRVCKGPSALFSDAAGTRSGGVNGDDTFAAKEGVSQSRDGDRVVSGEAGAVGDAVHRRRASSLRAAVVGASPCRRRSVDHVLRDRLLQAREEFSTLRTQLSTNPSA